MLVDHDYHPDQPTARIFRTPSRGVLRLDDDIAISEAVYDGVVLRHYAFTGHWFKVNVTTGLDGRLTETGDPAAGSRSTATSPRRWSAMGTARSVSTCSPTSWSGDDATSYVVAERDEFEDMLSHGVIWAAEGRGAEHGLRELVDLIEAGRLLG